MSREESGWRQSSDYLAKSETPGSYEYGSQDGRNLCLFSDENERRSKSYVLGRGQKTLNDYKLRRTSSLEGFREDEERSEASDEDAKK